MGARPNATRPGSTRPNSTRPGIGLVRLLDTLLATGLVPDRVLRIGIRRLLRQRLRDEGRFDPVRRARRQAALDKALSSTAIATDTDAANEQHYEVPPRFFEAVLGPRLKYSAAQWLDVRSDSAQPDPRRDSAHAAQSESGLGAAETSMIETYIERGKLANGQRILELGCGWGSLCLELARRFPRSTIVGVSNSAPQRQFIESRIDAEGLSNLEIETADINAFQPEDSFERIVSIEMLEHVRNHRALFARIAGWLVPEGLLFVHVFCHRTLAYLFEPEDAGDWMSRHFFTGGIMPSVALLPMAAEGLLTLDEQWLVNGRHYAKTARAWLDNMDAARAAIEPLFASTYGASEVRRWWCYWRIFFMACEELFGFDAGEEWMVAHYRFARID